MPTHEELAQFLREYANLTPEEKTQFLTAVRKLVADLRAGMVFRPSLRVKGVQGHPHLYEMTWAPDGRATFEYGAAQHSGDAPLSGAASADTISSRLPNRGDAAPGSFPLA